MSSTSQFFTHVNPQHLHGDYNSSEHPQPIAVDDWSQLFLDQASFNVYPYAQFGHPSLLNTPFVFPAVVSEFSNAVGGSLFLTPPMPTSEIPILGNELAQSTSTSVKEMISSVSESTSFASPFCSLKYNDIFQQFQFNNLPDLSIDVFEVSSHKQDPDTSKNVHLIEGITTTNKREVTGEDLPPQKRTKCAPESTVVKTEKKYTCPDCGKCFGRRLDNLKRHQEQKHLTKQELEEKGKLFKCPYEGCRRSKTEFGLQSKQSLDRHMNVCKFKPITTSSSSSHSAS